MKKVLFVSLLACALLMGLGGPAAAAEKKFNHFFIDIPGGCAAAEKDGLVTVNCGQGAFFTIGLFNAAEAAQFAGVFSKAEAGRLSVRQFAEKQSEKLKGTAPAKVDKAWTFQAMSGRVLTNVEITSDGVYTVMFISEASDKDWPDALQQAYTSLRGADADIDEFIQKSLFDE